MDYWKECLAEAFEDAGIVATKEQLDMVTTWVEGAYDNRSMATGSDCIPNPLRQENEKLQKELQIERSKVVCDECNGTGRWVSHGPHHSGLSSCSRCRGEGKRVP